MSAVMLSINPKWCELIANGIKTVEVRKTRPKIETPFKCYIYCTKPKMITKYVFRPEDYPEYMRPEKPVFCKTTDGSSPFCSEVNGTGTVIGEFVCDNAEVLFDTNGNSENYMTDILPSILQKTALSYDEFAAYVGSRADKNSIYGWHISDFKIYDKPRELREFKKAGFMTEEDWLAALYPNTHCHYEAWAKRFEVTRPPQSWCYVEELQG